LDYKSLFFRVKNPKDLSLLKDYQQYLNSIDNNFSITSVYFPYRSTESQTQKSYWQKVIDELEGTNISFSIIVWDLEEEALLSKIKEMTDYANERNVIAVLYPHDNSSMPDAESALEIIKKLGSPDNLKLSFHLCHEGRAGNAYRLEEVAKKVEDYIELVTISGSSKGFDKGVRAGDWSKAIQPLVGSEYDLSLFIESLKSIKYQGPVILHTFGIKEPPPEVHLKESMNVWNKLIQ
jgi:sugar phosphate isomerase/epimerase